MQNNRIYVAVAFWLMVMTAIELFIFGKQELGSFRVNALLTLMTTKALLVALVYMNLRKEGWALKLAFFLPIPVAIYFLLFLVYDAAYIWRS